MKRKKGGSLWSGILCSICSGIGGSLYCGMGGSLSAEFPVGKQIEKKVNFNLLVKKPKFYAVVVGTAKYANPQINLKYPEKDAQSISKSLKMGAEKLFGPENTFIYTLTTEKDNLTSKENILSTLKGIAAQANSSDIVFVYLSGHGITWGGEQGDFYYLTSSATGANTHVFNDEYIRKSSTISTFELTEILNQIPALKQIMVIDACGSGKAVENLIATRNIDASQIKAIDRMKDRTGMFVISGSAADAVSYEASRYGQGLLTYSILEAMKGGQLRKDGNAEFFDVSMIFNYALEKVPVLAADIGGIQKPLLLIPKGGSFDFGQATDSIKQNIPLNNVKPVFVRTTFFDINEMDDVRNLSGDMDEKLNFIANQKINDNIVFLDVREFPNAYRLTGGYSNSNGKLTLKLKIKGLKDQEWLLKSNSTTDLINQVAKIIENVN